MADPIHPETGDPIHRATRSMTLTYKGKSITFEMPGWYCAESEKGRHTGDDINVSDRMLSLLKPRVEGA